MTYQLLKDIAPKELIIEELHTMPKGLRGFLIDKTIYINNDYTDREKMFTLAHELTHYYLHHDKKDTRAHPQHKEFEEQADRGAYMLKYKGVISFNNEREGVEYETE